MEAEPDVLPGAGTVNFRKAVIVTNNVDGFLVGIECGQACYIEEDHPVNSAVLADLFAEIVDPDDDLPADYAVGFLVGFLDALLQVSQTLHPSGGKMIQMCRGAMMEIRFSV